MHRPCGLRFEALESRLCLSVSLPDSPWGFAITPVPMDGGSAGIFDSASVNRALTGDARVQQSPSVAVNPGDDLHAAVAYLDYALLDTGYAGIGVAVTRDGGENWLHRSVPLPTGFEQGASDPVVQFDGQGHVFVSFMAATFLDPVSSPAVLSPAAGYPKDWGFQTNNGIFIARSDDGGDTWQPATAVVSHTFEGSEVPFEIFPDLAIDTVRRLPNGAANPAYGNLYATWARLYPAGQFPGQPNATGGSDVMLAVSQDGGRTWETRTESPGGVGPAISVLRAGNNNGTDLAAGFGYMLWPRVAVGAEGDVAVADFSGAWFLVNHSPDAGRHFNLPTGEGSLGLPFGAGPRLVTAGLTNNRLSRPVVLPVRAMAADPMRPGHLYVAEPLPVVDAVGQPIDAADIFFARSENYGRTWEPQIIHGGLGGRIINDDNGGKPATASLQDVTADQFLVRLRVDPQGNVGLVWYDTRRDPANHLLDVYGTFSTDGGRTFAPNFRVTDQSFDADRGVFIDRWGNESYYSGDSLGLAMAGDVAYVAWTDTSAGNQDIFFRRVPLRPAPAPANDRFEPNDTAGAATVIGPVLSRSFARLAAAAGDEDWYQLQSLATGTLKVTAAVPTDSADLELEIRDSSGERILARGTARRDGAGDVVAWQAATSASTEEVFYVRVTTAASPVSYRLEVSALTQDLGAVVFRNVDGALRAGERRYYLLESAASGALAARFAPVGNSRGEAVIAVLDASDRSELAAASGAAPQATAAVKQGQRVLVRISGSAAEAGGFEGAFRLELANLDQYAAPAQSVLKFPAGIGPSQAAVADFNQDGVPDIAVTNTGTNVVSVSLGNGDGTFTTARQFAVGAFRTPNRVGEDAHLNTYRRAILAEDFNGDGALDLAVTNYDSADVSVLLGNGNGTFQAQRRFDATAFPIGLAAGDVNGDGILDLVVVDSPESGRPQLAVLVGRGVEAGQGVAFLPQARGTLRTNLFFGTIELADLDRDGDLDLILGGGNAQGIDVFLGRGNGSFAPPRRYPGSRQATDLLVADIDQDGNLDLLATSLSEENAIVLLRGNGAGGFGPPQGFSAGQGPLAVEVADWGSLADGSQSLGPPDGLPDLIVANSGVIPGPFLPVGPPGIVILPAIGDGNGRFLRFGEPLPLVPAAQPLDLDIQDFDGDGAADILVVDRGGLFILFGRTPEIRSNTTQQTARDLGTVVHAVQPRLTIVPAREEAWFRIEVPTEAVPGAGDEVLDFSGGFAHVSGAGLHMQVIDAAGNVRGSGERFRIAAQQGETLLVRIYGLRDSGGELGTGAYTLVIDALPQLVAVEAPALLPGRDGPPGGPVASLVLVFQGDRLDPARAENPSNYRITWLGPDRAAGTADGRVVVVGVGLESSRPVVYSPGGNVDVSSGRTFPTAVRQTVTLLFSEPLPAGAYRVEVASEVQAAPFFEGELDLLTPRTDFSGHPIVSLLAGDVREGAALTDFDLVHPRGAISDEFREFESGTRFLTQLHDDLGALLDSLLSQEGDRPTVDTHRLLEHIVARLSPALGAAGERLAELLVILLDPVSFGVVDPDGKTSAYDLQTNSVTNRLPATYVEVGGNVELVAIANPRGTYVLHVSDVPALARGGWVYFGGLRTEIQQITDDLRLSDRRRFEIGSAVASPGTLSEGPASVPLVWLRGGNPAGGGATQPVAGRPGPSSADTAAATTRSPLSFAGLQTARGWTDSQTSHGYSNKAASWLAELQDFWRPLVTRRLRALTRSLSVRGALDGALLRGILSAAEWRAPRSVLADFLQGVWKRLRDPDARTAVIPQEGGNRGRESPPVTPPAPAQAEAHTPPAARNTPAETPVSDAQAKSANAVAATETAPAHPVAEPPPDEPSGA